MIAKKFLAVFTAVCFLQSWAAAPFEGAIAGVPAGGAGFVFSSALGRLT